MDMFLFLIGMLAFMVALIWGIISAVKKTGKAKKKFMVAIGGVVLMIIGLSISTPNAKTSATPTNTPDKKSKEKKEEKKDAPLSLKVDDEELKVKVLHNKDSYSVSGQTIKGAEVKVNDEKAVVTEHGYFNTRVALKDGKNVVKVVATTANEEKQATITILREDKATYEKRIIEDKKKQREAEAKAKAEAEAKKKKEEEKKRQARIEKQKKEEAEKKERLYGNAVAQAENYISTMPFSKSGLIKQLKYEGYSQDASTYAANHIEVNWKEQAAKAAENYLDTMPFSRSSLIQQLKYEGYSQEEAIYGVDKAGL